MTSTSVGVLIHMTAWVTAKIISCYFQFLFYSKIASALVWVELKIFSLANWHPFFDAFCFFDGREPRIDCMLLTEAASVPRKDFSTSSLEKDEANATWDMVGTVHLLGATGWAAKYSTLQCGAKVKF